MYSLGRQLVEGFVICFLKVPPILLGQHGSNSTAKGPVELLENILQNLLLNLPPQTVFKMYPSVFPSLEVVCGLAEVDDGGCCGAGGGHPDDVYEEATSNTCASTFAASQASRGEIRGTTAGVKFRTRCR